MRAFLVVVVAALGLVVPGATAAAADSLVLAAHGTVTFQPPTTKCPGGRATTTVQNVVTGTTGNASACSGPPSACGEACLQTDVKYTFNLVGGKVVERLTQQQYGDSSASVAAVTASGSVIKATKRYADLNGSTVAGGGALFLNPDGTATANLTIAALASAASPAKRPAAAPVPTSQVVTLDGPITVGEASSKCSAGTASATGTLLPEGETGGLDACFLSATSCGDNCQDVEVRLDAHFDSGNFRAVVTAHVLSDASGNVSGETWSGTVKRGSGVFAPLEGRPFIGGGSVIGTDGHLAWAALA
jgi:hypothetical protein